MARKVKFDSKRLPNLTVTDRFISSFTKHKQYEVIIIIGINSGSATVHSTQVFRGKKVLYVGCIFVNSFALLTH